MANKGKRISELTALTSASLQTTLVGVDNGTTYKVTLDVLEDAIVSMVSRSTDLRLDALEDYTASYSATTIPIGTISSSAQISNFGFISSSHTDITSLNSFTQSQDILNSAFTNGMNARLQTSSFNDFSASVHNEILSATNEQSFNGLISGSSQLTSSYDERYLLSGSITQTTWDNIGGKPDGIVSQSVDIADFTFTPNTIQNSNVTIVASDGDIVLNADGNVYKGSANAGNGFVTDGLLDTIIGDTNRINTGTGYSITNNLDNIINSIPSLSSLNTFTASQEVLNTTFATTGSNVFNGNQTIDGSLIFTTPSIIEIASTLSILTPSAGVPNDVSNWNGQGGWNEGFYSNLATTGGTGTGLTVDVAAGGAGYIDINAISINTPGSGYTNGDIITINNENNLPGEFTISIENGSGWEFNTSGSLTTPGDINVSGSIYADNLVGLVSSSAQITAFGFVSSSTSTDLTELNQFTQSIDSRVDSLEASTSSFLTSLNGTFSSSIQILGGSGVYSSSAQLPSGLISGSSQLTSSYDTRYTLSGSVVSGTTPAGTISGSSQLTSSFDSRYLVTGSVTSSINQLNTFTASISTASLVTSITNLNIVSASLNTKTGSYATTGSNSFNGNQTITGSLIVSSVAVISASLTMPSGSVISLTSGSSLFVDVSGAITGSLTGSVFGIGDVVAFSSSVNSRLNSAGGGTVAGTISSSAQITTFGFVSGSYETTGRGIISSSANLVTTSSFNSYTASISTASLVTSITNLNSATASYLTSLNGTISSSSQLTSSFDTRYTLSGSVVNGTTPSGTISGSSQLTSSFDLRYLVTGSVTSSISALNTFSASENTKASTLATYTSSLNIWTSSVVTTGSNSFNGNQTITGSLTVSSIATISSSFTANSSSLTLNSGSNLYIQNNGIAQITGSLVVSGSSTLIGPLTISSGSLTMPDRPAFKVVGAGSSWGATRTLSGSAYTLDFQQGSGWDISTGIFTAPIAGLYQVNLIGRAYSNTGVMSQIIAYKTTAIGAVTTTQIMIEWGANTTTNHIGGSTITKMAVGDTLKAVVAAGSCSFDTNDNFSVSYIG